MKYIKPIVFFACIAVGYYIAYPFIIAHCHLTCAAVFVFLILTAPILGLMPDAIFKIPHPKNIYIARLVTAIFLSISILSLPILIYGYSLIAAMYKFLTTYEFKAHSFVIKGLDGLDQTSIAEFFLYGAIIMLNVYIFKYFTKECAKKLPKFLNLLCAVASIFQIAASGCFLSISAILLFYYIRAMGETTVRLHGFAAIIIYILWYLKFVTLQIFQFANNLKKRDA